MSSQPTKNQGSGEDLKVLAHARSRYNDIFVIQSGTHREMWFRGNGDFFLQSRIDPARPQDLVLVYSRLTMAALLFRPPLKRVLVIGQGGGVLPAALARWFPGLIIDVVEIDAKVTALCQRFFFPLDQKGVTVHTEDGRSFLERTQGKLLYDLVILDAFKSGSIPFHLKTVEFYERIRGVLSPDGVVATNLYGPSNEHKPSDWKTLTAVFEHLYFFEDEEGRATVAVGTRDKSRMTADVLKKRAAAYPRPPGMNLDLVHLAERWVEPDFTSPSARVFVDAIQGSDLKRIIDNNNRLDPVGKVPYTLVNLH
ncbi:putative Spermidine synthase [Nitrospina gracilis 3/211]|uniref:Putative Spermidine synthase n=1 Tax=Nitrospina gracilis (strain 3/211) TaxID=1266370 RepID=M1YVA8_NITG3|nr:MULTISPECIES: fused MFS/spermidine synthase [Nitrospina]MCF8722560.1 spermidine synthase [Nitrospina sp. Nb-3]CCQ89240.1 putative Spermidine synthase [Nitrospina gracilis 3/211]